MNIISIFYRAVLFFSVFLGWISVSMGQPAGRFMSQAEREMQANAIQAAAQECLGDYNALKLAGVRLASRGTAGLRCQSFGILACPLQTRIDTEDRHFGNNTSGWKYLGSRSVYCVSETVLSPYPGFKRDLCENDANSGKSEFKDGFGQDLEFAWVGSNDSGACHCRPKGSTTPFAQSPDCSMQNPFGGPQATMAAGGRDLSLPIDTSTALTENSGEAVGVTGLNPALRNSAAEGVDQPNNTPSSSTESPQLVSCADTAFTTLIDRCENNATAAETECRSPELGQGARAARNAMDVGQQVNLAAHQGAGMKQQCLNGALVATAATESIEQVYGNCRAMVSSCRSLCNPDTVAREIETRCSANVGTGANSALNRTYLDNKKSQVQSRIASSSTRCISATSAERELGQLFAQSGNALTAAARCACQTSSNTTNCNTMPTASQCGQDSSLPGCEFYGQVAVCAVNTSTYNAELCSCASNPNSASCGGASIANTNVTPPNLQNTESGPSSFGVAQPTASTGNAGGAAVTVASAPSTSSINLSSVADQDIQKVKLRGDSEGVGTAVKSSGSNSLGGSVSGGAGGNSSASLDDGTSSEVDGQAGSGFFGGVFSQIKNSVLSKFGKSGGSSSNRDGVSLNGRKKNIADGFNSKKFKPKRLRGVAAESDEYGLGLKNMDIWKMMNRCTRGESCKSNLDGFITDP